MFNKKNVFQLLFAVLLTLLLAACGGNNEGATGDDVDSTETNGESADSESSQEAEIKIGIANITSEANSWSQNLAKIGEELAEKSDGRITVDLYPAGQMGNEEDMMQQLNAGSLQMAAITMAQLSTASPAFNGWMLPYLVEDHDQAYELITSDEALGLFDTLTTDNVKGLGYVFGGFRNMVSTKPIETAADLENFTLRTTPSPLILDFWTEQGVSPTQMPLTEVYSAMQTGVVEGLETDTESLVTEGLMEGTEYMIPLNHMYWVGGIMVNQDFWDGLSTEDQKLIEDAVDVAMEFNLGIVKDREAEFETVATEEYGLTISSFDSQAETAHFIDDFRAKWAEESQSPELDAFIQKAEEIVGAGN